MTIGSYIASNLLLNRLKIKATNQTAKQGQK
jgi:hypothetical protein